jgi:hypothetical protein
MKKRLHKKSCVYNNIKNYDNVITVIVITIHDKANRC